jgi:hypothetical protein
MGVTAFLNSIIMLNIVDIVHLSRLLSALYHLMPWLEQTVETPYWFLIMLVIVGFILGRFTNRSRYRRPPQSNGPHSCKTPFACRCTYYYRDL